MLDQLRRGLSYANVMSTLAVFAVLGGGAYAAATIGAGDIKKNAVRAKHIRANAVTSKKVDDGSLRAKDVKPGELTRGATRQGSVPYGLNPLTELASTSVNVGPDPRRVFILADVEYFGTLNPCQALIVLEWQGQQRDETASAQRSPGAASGNTRGSLVTTAMPQLPPGTHTIKVNGFVSAGCSFTNLPGNLHAIVLDE
jgi:hypothetical protein